ncbi:MAG: hypothetical protein RJA69_1772, partial [Pseudomonadota bacterium]
AKSLAEDFFKRFDAAAAERFAASTAQADTGATVGDVSPTAAPAGGTSNVWMWGAGAAVLAALVWLLSR